MVFQQEQVRVLKEYYVRRNDKPTEDECSVIGASIAPPLTANQVYQWFARERVKAQNGKSSININNPLKKQNLNNFKFSSTPSTLKLESSFEEAPLSPDSQGSDESMLDLKQKLSLLCPKSCLSESALIPFAKIMNTHNKKSEDIEQILKLIKNTKTSPQVLQRFVSSKAFVTLCNLKQIIFESNNTKLQNLYLDVFMLLPFDLKIFNEFKVPKYFKQVWEKEIKDQVVLQNLNELYKKWRSDATTTANNNVKRPSLEPFQSDVKRQRTDEKKTLQSIPSTKSSVFVQLQTPSRKEITPISVIPVVKPPVAKSSIFAQLQTSKLDGRPIVHRTSSELISGHFRGSMDDADTKDSPMMPSYKRTASPPLMKEESISEKTGKPKKTVRFNFEKLDSTVYFLIDDRPDQISGIQGPLPSRSTDMLMSDPDVAHIAWQTPLPLSLPHSVQKCIVNSPEAIFQELRERNAMSAVYLNPKLIPSSPAEPTIVEFTSTEPVRWMLNKSPVEDIAIDNKILSSIPFLSVLMGHSQPSGISQPWIPPQQTLLAQPNSYPMSSFGLSSGAEPYNQYSSTSQNYSQGYSQNNSQGRR